MKNFIRKTIQLSTSRLVYLFIGLSFALVIIVVQAAISTPTVSSGQVLTATLWNTMVSDLNDLDNRVIAIETGGGGLDCITRSATGTDTATATCDSGYTVVGGGCIHQMNHYQAGGAESGATWREAGTFTSDGYVCSIASTGVINAYVQPVDVTAQARCCR